ncbi:cytochrome oxidase, 20 [Scheffersomyces amazonensis]|uniref:cytochrome oxidase, 20 n=1 Tax=Scheffersomyces amazonensis TaxID=1078765 RepID=UPI00315D827F
MGWFGGSVPAKVSGVSELHENANATPQFLEDLPPKFEDMDPSSALANKSRRQQQQYEQERQATLMDAASKLSLSDFTVERFLGMPCFREAMITGFQSMGVLGAVTFLIHKNFSRSFNWSMCGFFLGNIVGWEQCRSLRRRSFQMMEEARRKKEEKNKKKFEQHQQEADDQYEKFKEFNDRGN